MPRTDAPNDDSNTRATGTDNECQAEDRGSTEYLPAPPTAAVLIDGLHERRGIQLLTELEADSGERIAGSLANQQLLFRELLAPPKYPANAAAIVSPAIMRALEAEAVRSSQMAKLCAEAFRCDGFAEQLATAERVRSVMMQAVSNPTLASAIVEASRQAVAAAGILQDMTVASLFEVTEAQRAARTLVGGFAADMARTVPQWSGIIATRHISSSTRQGMAGHKMGALHQDHEASRHHRLLDALSGLTPELDPILAPYRSSASGLRSSSDLRARREGGAHGTFRESLDVARGSDFLLTEYGAADLALVMQIARVLGWEPERLLHALSRQLESQPAISMHRVWSSGVTARPESVETALGVNAVIIQDKGGGYTVRHRNQSVDLPPLKGLAILKILVEKPGKLFGVVELWTLASKVAPGRAGLHDQETRGLVARGGKTVAQSVDASAMPASDETAMRDYRDRLEDIDQETIVAERMDDLATKSRLAEEREQILACLPSSLEGSKRRRLHSDQEERARKNVRKLIGKAREAIARVAPAIELHLRQNIETGYQCRYRGK